MSWFGWLTKPWLEVTMLDELTMVAEFIGVAVAMTVIYFWGSGIAWMIRDWKDSKGEH